MFVICHSRKLVCAGAALRTLSEDARRFLLRLDAVLLIHIHQPEYPITALAHDLAMSARSVRQRIQALLGVTPSRLLRRFRLERALELMDQWTCNKNIIQCVGFNLDP